jgi:hypothetical protein
LLQELEGPQFLVEMVQLTLLLPGAISVSTFMEQQVSYSRKSITSKLEKMLLILSGSKCLNYEFDSIN